MKTIKKTIFLAFFLALGFSTYAGYIIKSVDTVEGIEKETTIYVDGDKIRIDDQEMDMIMDFENDEFFMIMENQALYVHENISGLPDKIQEVKELMIEEMLKQVPEDQRDQMRENYKNMMDQQEETYQGDVRIESAGPGGKIAGYDTETYHIFENDNKVESVWIADDLKLFDMSKIRELFKNFTGMVGYEDSEAYLDLMDKGMIMKSIDVETGDREEIVEVTKTSIDQDRFQPDTSLEKVSFKEFNMMMMQQED